MKLIDKNTLITEIERQQRKLCILSQSNEVELRKNAAIQNGVFCSLLSFIETLEVKEVDLESEIDKFYGIYRKNGITYDKSDNEVCFDWKDDELSEHEIHLAKHFFELGLKIIKGE